MALDGIRLSDLYSTPDYNKWMADSTNRKLVDYAVGLNPETSERTISGHFYLNSKIKEAIGEDGFSKLPKMRLQEKLDWVNNNLSPDIFGSSTMEEPEIVQPQMEQQQDTVRQMAPTPPPEFEDEMAVGSQTPFVLPKKNGWNGKTIVEQTLRDWFRDEAGGDYTGFLESRRRKREEEEEERREFPNIDLTGVWGSGYKSGETKQLEDELSVLRETNPNNTLAIKLKENQLKISRENDYKQTKNAFNELTQEEELRSAIAGSRPKHFSPVNRSLWGDPATQQKVDELTSDLRKRFDEDPTFTYDTFKNFEDEMAKYVPKYKYYHDTWAMPFSPDEMKDIMAEYYSLRQIKDGNEAINFAYSVFQNRLAQNQSLYDKASVALMQDGANIMGYGTAAVGIWLNSLEGAWKATSREDDIDGLGWWKEFLYYASDNPVTRYGNNVVRTGKWNTQAQEEYARDNVNALELFRKPGNETKFLDPNTAFDLVAQSGFTVGGMIISSGVANVLANTVGRGSAILATDMLAKGSGAAASRVVSKGVEVLGKQLVTIGAAYLPAAAEASMDAEETYTTAKNNAADNVLLGMEDQLRREYEDGTYEMWYQRNSRLPYTLDPEHPMTKEQEEELAQLRQQERAYLWDTYQNLRQQEVLSDPEVQRFIETGAKRAAARNLFDEATWIALGDYTISNALGKSFRAVKEKSWRALFGDPKTQFKWVPEGNHYRPVVREITFADKARAIGRGVLEAGEEGFEELFQTVDSKLRQDLNQHMIAQYIENRFDPESTAVVTDKARKNWELVNKSLGENILSEEAVFSFLMGAVSTGLGSPTLFRGIRTGVDARRKGDSFGQSFLKGLTASVRNPFVENWNDMKVKKLEEQQEADELNRWITAHQDELDTLNDEVAILKFIDQQAQAVRAGDEATYRDAVMGQTVATMLMMERVNPNGSKINFYERIKQLADLKPTDPEARDVLEQAISYRGEDGITRTSEGPLNREEAAIIEDVSKKAQDLLNTQKALKQEISILNNQFGNTISRETRDALAYSLIMQQDWTSRIASIQENAVRAYNEANLETRVTPISTEEQPSLNALARYGSKENIEAEFKELIKKREAIKARRKEMYRYEYKSEFAKVQKQIKANRDASRAFAKLEEGRVITAQEILSLSPTERAYLLDEANRKNYSEAQQREISIFETSDGIRGDMITDLIDAGRLQAKKEYFKEEYDALLENDKAIPLFDREVRKKASKTWTRAKLATAMEATTYDEFRDAMDKSLQTGEFSAMDRMSMSEIFNEKEVRKETNEFYQRYKKEEMTRRAIRGIIENSPEFKSLGEAEKEVVSDAVEQVQRDGKEVTAETILAKLFDKEYLDQLERQGIDTTPIIQSAEELAKAVEKAMAQKAVYDENVAALKRAAEQRAQANQTTQDPSKTAKTEGKTKTEPQTVIAKDRYEQGKAKLDVVFGKLANNATSRKQKPLTTDEYVALMSLYTGEPIVGDILVDGLNTAISREAFLENIEKLEKAVEGKLYTDETAKDNPEVVNTLMLAATLQDILNKVNAIAMTGRPSTVQTFIKNTILQVRPDLKKSFEPKERTIDPKKLKRLDAKATQYLTTETEKRWYEEQKISENLKTLSGLNSTDLKFVLIKDSALEGQLQDELKSELDDDNLPVIIAARVPLKTPGAIQGKDGYSYLYLGLLTESRAIPVAEERNQYNNVRAILMEQEDDGPLVYRGKVLTTVLHIEKQTTTTTTDREETTSFRDFLLDKYSDRPEKERKAAALEDLKQHYRRVKITVKDGVATAAYSWPKKGPDGEVKEVTVTRTWSTTAPDDAQGRTQGAYIMEDPHTGVTKPIFLEVRGIDDVSFDGERGIYEMLGDSDIDITSQNYAANEGNYVRKAIVGVQTFIAKNKGLFTSREGLLRLNGTVSKPGLFEACISKYFNLLKTADYARGEISLGIDVVDDEIKITAWKTGTEKDKDGKKSAYGIPTELGSMPLSILKQSDAEIRRVVASTMKGVMQKLIFDESGNIRTHERNGREWPLIKFEDNFAKNDPSVERMYDGDDVAVKFLGNIWQARSYAFDPVPESISVEPVALGPQGPIDPSSANPQQEAIRRITAPEFIDEHEGEHFELSAGETEVTTFIKGGEDDIDWGLETLIGKFATNLGTSIDKLYRVYRQTKDKSVPEIVSYMKKKGAGSWPGLRWTAEMGSMLEQFKRIDKFFADRGEVQVNADLIFRTEVVYGSKKKFLVGKPDIITVDKQGIYHIYDMKTFRYSGTTASQVPGFTSPSFTIRGKRNMEKDMDKWRKQLSMYKAMIESALGPGTVSSSLGIIPVRLGYNPSGSIDPNPIPGIGAHKVYDATGKNMYLSFEAAPMETSPKGGPEPITRCYDQPIRLDAIEKLDDINPEGWKDTTAADEYSVRLGELKGTRYRIEEKSTEGPDLLEGVQIPKAKSETAEETNAAIDAVVADDIGVVYEAEGGGEDTSTETQGSPELTGPVFMRKPVEQRTGEEIQKELSGDESVFEGLDDLLNQNGCGYK